jgi:hypothetical protein
MAIEPFNPFDDLALAGTLPQFNVPPPPPPPTSKTFTATDGKVFTDELAYATYQASLNTSEAATASAASAAATAKATKDQEAEAEAEEKLRKGTVCF